MHACRCGLSPKKTRRARGTAWRSSRCCAGGSSLRMRPVRVWLCVLLECAWLRWSASAAVLHVGVKFCALQALPSCNPLRRGASFAWLQLDVGSVGHQSTESLWCAGFFFGFNSLVAMGSIVTVLWFGARQVRVHAWHRWDGNEVLPVIIWLG